jgi:hypothetical protein
MHMTGGEPHLTNSSIVYRRELPGGGYVAIDRDVDPGADETPRTRVWVERRSASQRRSGHSPLIIAEIEGDERSPAFADLFRMASDNAAIARALMQWQVEHPELAD